MTLSNVKCILIDPPITTVEKSEGIKDALKQHAIYPPIGLAYIAAVLRENGIDVKIIDARSLGMPPEEVIGIVGKEKSDFVGITALTSQLNSVLFLSKKIKELYPHTKIILGGAHVHFEHKEIIKNESVDFCVRGEGEITMVELINTVVSEGDLRKVNGITFNEEDIVVTPDRPFIKNLDALPFPARDLLPNHAYRGYIAGEEENFTAVLATRGCPFRCKFCAVPAMWKTQRRRSVGNVLNELEHIREKCGIERIRFSDDLFCSNKKWVIKLCRGMVERGLNTISWSCDGRVGLMSEELLQEMKKANCQIIFYGIEFGNQRMLDFSGKGTMIPQIYETIDITKKAGISPYGYFMIGYPTETKETIEDTINLARSLNIDYAGFSMVTPFPGTKLYEYCKKNNLLKTTDWNKYDMIQPGKSVIKLTDVSDDELMGLYQSAHREFYFRHIRDRLREDLFDLLELQDIKLDNGLNNPKREVRA